MNAMTTRGIREGALVLSDGSVFEGELIGAAISAAAPIAAGEVVFNTVLSGYQEVITDPSYAGQIITFTYPHIGNYGINATDFESAGTFCRGIVVRDLARRHSNFRAQSDLGSMLFQQGVPGIAGSTPGASRASSATAARCPVRLVQPRNPSYSQPPEPSQAPTVSTSSGR